MNLNAIEQGAGPPCLLLHGLFGAAKNLGAVARGLAGQMRVISLDLRNHGDSPHQAAMDYQTMAKDVAQTMDGLGLQTACVVGHSMGGKTAMALALAWPQYVERLAVMDIAPVAYHHGYDAYMRAMQAIDLQPGLTRHQADAALAQVVAEPAMRAFLLNNLILGESPHWRLGLAEIDAAMADLQDWQAPKAALYDGPALFLRGANSDYVQAAARAEIMRLFPQAKFETVENAGHWLHAEQPQAVIAALQAFLS